MSNPVFDGRGLEVDSVEWVPLGIPTLRFRLKYLGPSLSTTVTYEAVDLAGRESKGTLVGSFMQGAPTQAHIEFPIGTIGVARVALNAMASFSLQKMGKGKGRKIAPAPKGPPPGPAVHGAGEPPPKNAGMP